jgi:ribosomal protein S27E
MMSSSSTKPYDNLDTYVGYTCLDCGSHNNKVVEFEIEKNWSTKKTIKKRVCFDCNSDKLVKHCPQCKSINILEDLSLAMINCRECGLVLRSPPPMYAGYNRVSYPWGCLPDLRYDNTHSAVYIDEETIWTEDAIKK